jgi:2'-5' RNA ligase
MRCFIAIELSEEMKKEILRLQGLLQESGLLEAKYVGPEHMHLTLKFFGEVSEDGIGEIQKRLGNIVFPSFSCRLGKLGFFGERVLWIDLEDQGEFKQLHDMIDSVLSDLFEKDERFHNAKILGKPCIEIRGESWTSKNPEKTSAFKLRHTQRFFDHVTLARIKSIKDKVKMNEFVNDLEAEHLQFSVKSFELFTSVLTKKGPVYEKIKSFPLK